MKKFITLLFTAGMVFSLNSCLQMPTKIYHKQGTNVKSHPAKSHPYPVRSKDRNNQKHFKCNLYAE